MNRSPALRRFRLVAIAVFAALLAGTVWAGLGQGIGAGFAVIVAERWGLVTLFDLYLGLAMVALWIYAVEGDARRAVKWALALAVLGNLATVTYLVLRAGRVATVRELFLPTASGGRHQDGGPR